MRVKSAAANAGHAEKALRELTWSHSLTSPFAVVVMAHLKAQATRHKGRDRLRWKINLVRGLYERGYKRKEVFELLRFID